jgi:hypothetical protein
MPKFYIFCYTRRAATDRQIDQLVYELYGLIDEEIGLEEA